MTTVVKPDSLTDIEPEFAKPCTARDGPCPRPATWAVWSSHGGPCCPIDGFICDQCKEAVIVTCERQMKEHTVCRRCKVTYIGQLSDNLRFIKL